MNSSILGLVLIFAVVSAGKTKVQHYINMDPRSTPSLQESSLKIHAKIGQKMDISCPQYDSDAKANEIVTFQLYKVDEKSFQNCDVEGLTVVLNCSNPFENVKLTLKLQRMSPYPLGFTFQDGKTYYYLGIPNGEKGCDKAMRLAVDIEKEGVVVPGLDPVVKEEVATSTTTTTTTAKTTKSTTSTLMARITKRPTKKTPTPQRRTTTNGASNVQCFSLMTSLLAFLILWIHF